MPKILEIIQSFLKSNFFVNLQEEDDNSAFKRYLESNIAILTATDCSQTDKLLMEEEILKKIFSQENIEFFQLLKKAIISHYLQENTSEDVILKEILDKEITTFEALENWLYKQKETSLTVATTLLNDIVSKVVENDALSSPTTNPIDNKQPKENIISLFRAQGSDQTNKGELNPFFDRLKSASLIEASNKQITIFTKNSKIINTLIIRPESKFFLLFHNILDALSKRNLDVRKKIIDPKMPEVESSPSSEEKNPVLEKIEWFLSIPKIPLNKIKSAFYFDLTDPCKNWNIEENQDASDESCLQQQLEKIKKAAAIFCPTKGWASTKDICKKLEKLSKKETSPENQKAVLQLIFNSKGNVVFQLLKRTIIQHCIGENQNQSIDYARLFNSINTSLKNKRPMTFDDLVALCQEKAKLVDQVKASNKAVKDGLPSQATDSIDISFFSKRTQLEEIGFTTFTHDEFRSLNHGADDFLDDESIISTDETVFQPEKEVTITDPTSSVHNDHSSIQHHRAPPSFYEKYLSSTLGLVGLISMGVCLSTGMLVFGALSTAIVASVVIGVMGIGVGLFVYHQSHIQSKQAKQGEPIFNNNAQVQSKSPLCVSNSTAQTNTSMKFFEDTSKMQTEEVADQTLSVDITKLSLRS